MGICDLQIHIVGQKQLLGFSRESFPIHIMKEYIHRSPIECSEARLTIGKSSAGETNPIIQYPLPDPAPSWHFCTTAISYTNGDIMAVVLDILQNLGDLVRVMLPITVYGDHVFKILVQPVFEPGPYRLAFAFVRGMRDNGRTCLLSYFCGVIITSIVNHQDLIDMMFGLQNNAANRNFLIIAGDCC